MWCRWRKIDIIIRVFHKNNHLWRTQFSKVHVTSILKYSVPSLRIMDVLRIKLLINHLICQKRPWQYHSFTSLFAYCRFPPRSLIQFELVSKHNVFKEDAPAHLHLHIHDDPGIQPLWTDLTFHMLYSILSCIRLVPELTLVTVSFKVNQTFYNSDKKRRHLCKSKHVVCIMLNKPGFGWTEIFRTSWWYIKTRNNCSSYLFMATDSEQSEFITSFHLTNFIRSTKGDMFSLLLVCLSQDLAKTAERIAMKVGGRMGPGPREDPTFWGQMRKTGHLTFVGHWYQWVCELGRSLSVRGTAGPFPAEGHLILFL